MSDAPPPFPTPAAMPPLGPPYAPTPPSPPPPHYPPAPPEAWPVPPPLLPGPAAGPGPAPYRPMPGPPGPPAPDRSRLVIAGAIAVVAAVIIGVLVGENTGGDTNTLAAAATTTTTASPGRGSESGSSSSDPSPPTTESQDLDAVVLDIEQFVERERGLKFKQPITPKLAGEGEFQRLLLAEFDKERPALVEAQEVLTATGLLAPGTDVAAAERSLLEIGVVGFYDPETKQLVVRGSEITPYVREVLAHELTHALDDQWFNLNRPELDNPDDDSSAGWLGLVEGNARRVEDAYLASLTSDEQADAFLENERLIAEHPEVFDLPPILLTLLQQPYDDGPRFVEAVLDAGGQSRLDAAFVHPPVSVEQIIHPDRFLAGDEPKAVAVPAADGTASNHGVLGELLLREMLADGVPSAAEIEAAVTGWGGDSYVTWTDPSGRACLRDSFVGDTPADTAELLRAIQDWAPDRDAVVDAGGPVPTFTVCG